MLLDRFAKELVGVAASVIRSAARSPAFSLDIRHHIVVGAPSSVAARCTELKYFANGPDSVSAIHLSGTRARRLS
jgi:hypothetical protein